MNDRSAPKSADHAEEHFEIYLDGIRRLVDDRLIPEEHRLDGKDLLPADLAAAIRDAGLFGISIPRAYGGLGFSMEEQVRVMLEVTRASVVYRSRISTTIGLGSQPILDNGTEEQRAAWLPRMASGETIAAFALTEPDYGSDAGSIMTRAVRDGDDYVIDGAKRYITNACEAAVLIVMARTDPGSTGATGISAFIVPADRPGIRISPVDRKMGQDGAPTNDVIFEQVRVPASALISGREGGGFKTAMSGINHARLHVAVTCVGQAERLIHESLNHATRRVQFGQPIAGHQAVQAMLADSRAEALAARAMVLETARLVDRGEKALIDISCCKLFASEMVCRVADRAVQVHGGDGYMRGVAVERLYRDVRVFRIFEGTSQIQQGIIARLMLEPWRAQGA